MQRIHKKKQRDSGYTLEWQRNNKERLKEYGEKRQNKNHNINKKQWGACKEYFNNECAYCGLPISQHYNNVKGNIKLTDFHKEHVDHEGSNELNNCIPSCKICNSEKHKHKLENWYNENNSKYTYERLEKIIKWMTEDYKQFI